MLNEGLWIAESVEQSGFDVVLGFLAIMAILMTIVALIGLTGSMSLNVLERTREIGILRSIGASDNRIWSILISEGIFIGLISWAVGTA